MTKHTKERVYYTEEMTEKLFEEMETGKSYSKCCIEIGVDKGSMWRFINKSDTLKQRYIQARMMQISYKSNILEDLRNSEPRIFEGKVDMAWVAYLNAQLNTLKWELSKELPRIYGDKINSDVQSEVNLKLVDYRDKSDEI